MNSTHIDAAKSSLARDMRRVRSAAHRAAGRDAANSLLDIFKSARDQGLIVDRDMVVSGYWPRRDELDVRALMGSLHDEGILCALPVVRGDARPLQFRRWRPGDELGVGAFGISEPPDSAKTLEPDVLLLPLLAVDNQGNRLGQGGGYFDTTLRAFRAGPRPVVAAGLCFEAQRVASVPHDAGDEPLDWVVTERGAYRISV
jgi:5-formyltetrahydrofolate cyclo-ligase